VYYLVAQVENLEKTPAFSATGYLMSVRLPLAGGAGAQVNEGSMTPSANADLFLVAIPVVLIGLAVRRSRISDARHSNYCAKEGRRGKPPEEGAASRLTVALERPETAEHGAERRHREQIKWTKLTVVWLGLYTIITGIIACLGLRQLQIAIDATDAAKTAAAAAKSSAEANVGQLNEMRLSSRAWVGPNDASF
jgi:hypothetical protein